MSWLKLLYTGKATGKMLWCLEMEKNIRLEMSQRMKSSSSISQTRGNIRNYYTEICKNSIA